MNVYFLTRDVMADYPRVNWIPSLPGEAEELLNKLTSSPLRCHNIETPELIVKQNGENWSIFASAIDSGRIDCSGTPILITFYITGKAGVDMPPIRLVQHYIDEYLEGTDKPSVLSRYFSKKIADGDPEKWSKLSKEEKAAVANALLKSLANTKKKEKPSFSIKPFWCEHRYKKENFSYFSQFCSLLLDGGINGYAFLLPFLKEEKIEECLQVFGTTENIAILLSGENGNIEVASTAVSSDDEWGDVQIKAPAAREELKLFQKTEKIKNFFKKNKFFVILFGILTLLYIVVRIWFS